MRPSGICSACLRLAKLEQTPQVKFLGLALSSTSAHRQTLNGKRPVPDEKQVQELQNIGKELVQATVTRSRGQKKKDRKSNSLEERRRSEDLKIKGMSLSNKAKSPGRLEFESSPVDSDVVDITSPFINALSRLQPGDFVELRRNAAIVHGVVHSEGVDGKTTMINTVTQKGEIWTHRPEDVVVSIPGFTPRHLLDQIQPEQYPTQPEDSLARLKITKQLESFEIRTSSLERYYSSLVSKLYETVKANDPTHWAQLSTQAIILSNPPPKSDDNHEVAAMAIHKLLMSDPLHFIPSEHQSPSFTFSVRPSAEVENIQQVTKWIRENAPEISAFVAKAKEIITISPPETHIPQSPEQLEVELPSFTKSDLDIIDFIKCAIRKPSTHQVSPYEGFAPTIVKRLGVYRKDITTDVLFDFLRDIGVLPPWQDYILMTEEKAMVEGSISSKPSDKITKSQSFELADLRHDWGKLPVYVIDAEDAEELDDGISIEKLEDGTAWIHVHVADPTSKLLPSDPIALAAAARGTSLYAPQMTFPMLPKTFSISEHSLGRMDERNGQNVLTFSALVCEDGSIRESNVRAGVIHNVQVITYKDVENSWGEIIDSTQWPFGETIESRSPSPLSIEAKSDLEALRSVSMNRIHQLQSSGRFGWGLNGARPYFVDKSLPEQQQIPQLWRGYPKIVYGVESGDLSPARRVVAEAMILAGLAAGRFCTERGIPALYRTAEKPLGHETQLISSITPVDGRIPLDTALRSNLAGRPASYSTHPADHWPMDITADDGGYVRVTSPLRRFADMIMHWQIKGALLKQKEPVFSRAVMENYAARMLTREAVMKSINKAQNSYWAAVYIQHRLKRQGDDPVLHDIPGYVWRNPEFDTFARVNETRVFLPRLGIVGRLPTSDKPQWSVGDMVTVRVADVSMVGKARVCLEL
ncbi:RNB-domain-containing protein [Serendipita vermifera]|nr:RNB-domain-containing protein [Serendipita vermifera]